jgi:hypothetical protein
MSGVVTFVIHYGYGAVRSSNVAADLSEFQYEKLELTDPHSIRMRHIYLSRIIFH